MQTDPSEPDGPALDQGGDGFYLIAEAGDLAEAALWPTESYRLAADLDVAGVEVPQLGVIAPFAGELDGAGHIISGFTSSSGGLFSAIAADGLVHDLGVTGTVTRPANDVGMLVNTLRGALERVSTGGSVEGPSRVGGIAGTSFGTIRDSYSTADVATTSTDYAGGIVGIADSPSLTERVYATGTVEAARNTAGGIAGYARDRDTVVRSSFALNPTVTGGAFTQRVAARAASGQSATLEDNYAVETLVAATQSNPDEGPTTLNGETRTVAEAQSAGTWTSDLGWDLETVWVWDDTLLRPVLRGQDSVGSATTSADATDEPAAAPTGAGASATASGTASTDVRSPARPAGGTAGLAGTTGLTGRDPGAPVVVDRHGGHHPGRGVSHEAVRGQDGVTTVTVHAGADAAGEQVSVLVVAKRSDANRPRAEQILYLNEATADDAGDVTMRMTLPETRRGGPWIAVGTSAETRHYVARLDAAPAVVVTVDGAEVELAGRQTAGEILEAAGFEPDRYDLAERRGRHDRLHVFRDHHRISPAQGDAYETVVSRH